MSGPEQTQDAFDTTTTPSVIRRAGDLRREIDVSWTLDEVCVRVPFSLTGLLIRAAERPDVDCTA